MERYQRHRYALALPFVLLAVILVVGGVVNGATARGRVVDDFSDEPVKGAQLSVGKRSVSSEADGSYVFENVPRTTSIKVDVPEYSRANIPPDGGEVRLVPFSVRFEVNVEGTDPVERVPSAQIRQETRTLAATSQAGTTIVSPHPGKDAKVLVCAKGFQRREVVIRAVLMTVALKRDEAGDCPPLPTPSPAPGASPAASPATPAASPSPAATPSASPSPR